MTATSRRASLILSLLLGAAAQGFNLTDHATQNLARPEPRIGAWEAEAILQGGKQSAAVDDELSANGQSVQLRALDGRLAFTTPELARGTYSVWCIGRSTGKPSEYREPMYVQVFVKGPGLGPDGRKADQWRMRINYMQSMHQDVAHVYFDVNTAGVYDVAFELGEGSTFDLLVDRLELRDVLGNTWKKGFKREPGVFTQPAQPSTGNDAPAMFTRDEALQRAKDIAASFPPRNVLLVSGGMPTKGFYQEFSPGEEGLSEPNATRWAWRITADLEQPWVLRGPTVPVRDEMDRLVLDVGPGSGGGSSSALGGKAILKVGAKANTSFGVPPKDEPQFNWGTEKPGPEAAYTAADLAQFKKLPSRWPDDGNGYFQPAAESGTMRHNFYYNVVAGAFKGRYSALRQRICELADLYYRTGDPKVGFRAAVMLCHWADAYPSIDHTVQGTLNVTWGTYPFNTFTGRHYGSFGKLDYSGWAGPAAIDIVVAYDKLFTAVKDNQLLADAVGQNITWVKSPDDIVELLDVKLLQHIFDLFDRMYIRAAELRCPPIVAAVQGNNEAGLAMMREIVNHSDFQFASLVDMLTVSRSRDTTSFIGSMFYAKGPSLTAGTAVAEVLAFARSHQLGDFDLIRDKQYVLQQAANWLIEPYTAGVHVNGVGDVSGPQGYPSMPNDEDARRLLLAAWRDSGNPQFAWMIRHVTGMPPDLDSEQRERLLADAGKVKRDPRHDLPSRALQGFGVTMLEQGDGGVDFRKRHSVVVRTGYGSGHGHADQLNLEIFAHALVAAGEFGGRGGYGTPPTGAAQSHCLVTIDGRVSGYGRTEFVAHLPGTPAMTGSWRNRDGAAVRRFVSLIDAGEDNAYLFDVARASGGKQRTYWFHGNESETVDSSKVASLATGGLTAKAGDHELGLELDAMLQEDAGQFVWSSEVFSQNTGKAAKGVCNRSSYEAVWPLSRSMQETIINRIAQSHPFAEGQRPKSWYDPQGPRHFTRLILPGSKGRQVENVVATSVNVGYRIICTGISEEKPADEVSTFTGIIEPFAGKHFIRDARVQTCTPGDGATAVLVRIGEQRRDLLIHSAAADVQRKVAGDAPVTLKGAYGFVSRDAGGVRAAALVEGESLDAGDIAIVLPSARHAATITAWDFQQRTVQLDVALPASLLAGTHFMMGRDGEVFRIDRAEQVNGRTLLRHAKTAEAYSSPLFMVRGGREVIGVPEPEHQVHRWVTNEDASRGWPVVQTAFGTVRWMPTGHRGGATMGGEINWDLVPDADGDGVKTLTVEAHDDWQEAMRVQVLDIDPELRAFVFVPLNSPKGYGGSRSYAGGVVRNEAGKIITTAVIPGKMGSFFLPEGQTIRDGDIADVDGDGTIRFRVFYFGPGDAVSLPTWASLLRQDDGTWLLTANSPVTLTLPGAGAEVQTADGSWRKLAGTPAGAGVTAALAESDLNGGQVVVRIGR